MAVFGVARVLAASIAVVEDARGSTLCQGHVDGREHQLRTQLTLHRPTDDAAPGATR